MSDDHDRDETETERLDRNWGDLLQELRVMQTGAQLTAGFLLTLPFQTEFAKLDTYQRTLYLVLVLVAAVTTLLVMSAVAVHRRLSGEHAKEKVVETAHRLTMAVLTAIAVLVTGMVLLIVDVVVDRTVSFVLGGAVAATAILLMVVLPNLVLADGAGEPEAA
jgi:hypothetical protein